MLRRRSVLREFFPAAVEAFEAKADALLTVLDSPALRQPATTEGATRTVVAGQASIITALNEQIAGLQKVVTEHFGRHPAADIYLSQPGFAVVLAARTLGEFGEFGDDKRRFTSARAGKNYSGQGSITRAAGKKAVVLARYATNRRLGAAGAPASLRGAGRFAGRAGLLERATRPKHRPPRSPAPARGPARRDPAWLPQNWHRRQRGHRLATPPQRQREHRRLTKIRIAEDQQTGVATTD